MHWYIIVIISSDIVLHSSSVENLTREYRLMQEFKQNPLQKRVIEKQIYSRSTTKPFV